MLELARLIGQSDPFGPPPARSGDSPRAPDLPTRGPMARPPSRELSPGFDRYETERRHEADPEREQPQPRPHPFPALQTFPSRPSPPDDRGDDGYSEPARNDAPPAARERFEFPSLGGSERLGSSERIGGTERDQAHHGHSAYADETYPTVPDQHSPAEPEPTYVEGDHYPHPASTRPEASHRDDAYPHQGEQDAEYEGQYADAEGHRYDEYEYADDGAYEDDELGGKRRNWIKFALALLGVVVFGSAAAFGYRAIFRGGTDGPPPLIRADTSPTKIVPASTADAGAKPINDRLGSGERMVSREEQPVDLKDPARNPNGGVVAPLSGGAAVTGYPNAPATGAVPPASAGATEPKRVRTVTIHADPAAPAPAGPAAAAPAAPAPARAAVPRPAAQAPPTVAPSQSAAPLALTPQSQPQSQSSVAAVDTVRPPAPARAAPRPAEGANGMWVVQISAQKTEAEAQSAFRAAQTKYSVLGSYQPLIRKKDQGERGVFYAAQVGPLARDEANQLCENLKSAGGSCFIQRN